MLLAPAQHSERSPQAVRCVQKERPCVHVAEEGSTSTLWVSAGCGGLAKAK